MSIKQFNGSYIANEDRLLFRFNTADDSEIRFWLTRRITFFILAATAHLVEKQLEKIHPKTTAKVISEFQQETAREKADFSTAYQAVTKFPIGADPVLIVDVRCTLLEVEGQSVMSMDFVMQSGGQINMKLALATLQTMRVLLERLVLQSRWTDGPDAWIQNGVSAATEEVAGLPLSPSSDPKQVH